MGLPLSIDDWPTPPVRTRRLVVRSATSSDLDDLLDLGADPEVQRFLGGVRDRDELAERMGEDPGGRPGHFVLEHDSAFAGSLSISRREPERPGRVSVDGLDLELSYVLPVRAWGHGYAAEAGAAVLGWSDERFGEPVVLCTQTANVRSVALAERLGFLDVERFEEFGAEQWFGVRRPG
jgi:RimJ/RimL family protein N-acetyltransferase